jgi:hypothetical protein
MKAPMPRRAFFIFCIADIAVLVCVDVLAYFLDDFVPLAKPICERTHRKPMYERCSF